MSITQSTENPDLDAELAEVIESWESLSPEVKAKVMDLVRTAKDGEQ